MSKAHLPITARFTKITDDMQSSFETMNFETVRLANEWLSLMNNTAVPFIIKDFYIENPNQ